jgi:hypothetical protein
MSDTDIPAFHAAQGVAVNSAQQPQASSSTQPAYIPPSQGLMSRQNPKVICTCGAIANGKCHFKQCKTCCQRRALAAWNGDICGIQNHRESNRAAVQQQLYRTQQQYSQPPTQHPAPNASTWTQPQTTDNQEYARNTQAQDHPGYQGQLVPSSQPRDNSRPLSAAPVPPAPPSERPYIPEPYVLNANSSPRLQEKFNGAPSVASDVTKLKRPKPTRRFTLVLLESSDVCRTVPRTLYSSLTTYYRGSLTDFLLTFCPDERIHSSSLSIQMYSTSSK